MGGTKAAATCYPLPNRNCQSEEAENTPREWLKEVKQASLTMIVSSKHCEIFIMNQFAFLFPAGMNYDEATLVQVEKIQKEVCSHSTLPLASKLSINA